MKTRYRDKAANISESGNREWESGLNPYSILILFLTLVVPVTVMPKVVDNAFNTPKTLIMVLGVSCMVFLYFYDYLHGRMVRKARAKIYYILLFLIILNFISLLYTKNIYYTRVAALLNTTCLVFFYFISLHVDKKRASLFIVAATFSGFLVSINVWLQFFNIYILFDWISPGDITGTIGNSNYLGAYLIFPLYTSAGLILLARGKIRLATAALFLFILAAFFFSRARASWIGFFISFLFFLYLLKRIRNLSIRAYFRGNRSKIVIYGLILIVILAIIGAVAPRDARENMNFHKLFESETLRLRVKKYFPPSVWIFKQSPLFGMGLWSYRNMVYEAQAQISRTDPDFFKNYDAPKPRRAHNDYLEVLNDGGLVAAAGLLLFFIGIMSHGWLIIEDKRVDYQDRVTAAVCFCSIVAVMLAALFFFPFRVNSTLFMTALIMGMMEGIYLRNRGLIQGHRANRLNTAPILSILISFSLIGIIWYGGIKPLKGEMEYLQCKKSLAQGDRVGAERHLLRAIEYDPQNTSYLIYASQLYLNIFKNYQRAADFVETAINHFDGDVTLWSAYQIKGLIQFNMGRILEARSAFEKALYYHPYFKPAQEKLAEVKKFMEEHDGVTIKFK